MCKKTISVYDFFKKYPDNEVARKHLEKRRWNGKPVCPFCNKGDRVQIRKRVGYFRCAWCKKDFTVRTGTIFEKSNIQLHKWFYAIYLIMVYRKSVSSLQLSKELGVTQKTAWFMGHRIRAACSDNTSLLSGVIEVDETYIGGKESSKHRNKRVKGTQGRSTKTKVVVIGARQRGGKVKAKSFSKVDGKIMQGYLDSTIEKGSVLSTDEAGFYKAVKGYEKILVNHSAGEFVNGMASTNGIESVWAVLKRGYHGTFHHFSKKHLDRYVDEFAFRLVEGNVDVHVLDRMDNLLDNASNKTLPYKRLIASE